MARVLVTRPEPGASASAARLAALGHDVVTAPLLRVEARRWALPAPLPDALLFTSANAVRHGGRGLAALRGVPVWAVGAATAAAARAAGFVVTHTGDGGVADLAVGYAGPPLHLLHLAGEDRIDTAWPPRVRLEVVTVYAAVAAENLPAEAVAQLAADPPRIDCVLLYSPRTARIFAALCDAHGIHRARVAVAAISPAALAAAGAGWRAAAAAATPDEAALFAAAGLAVGLTSAPDGVEKPDGAAD